MDEVVAEKDKEIKTEIFKDLYSWSEKELEEGLENLRKLLYEARLDNLNLEETHQPISLKEEKDECKKDIDPEKEGTTKSENISDKDQEQIDLTLHAHFPKMKSHTKVSQSHKDILPGNVLKTCKTMTADEGHKAATSIVSQERDFKGITIGQSQQMIICIT